MKSEFPVFDAKGSFSEAVTLSRSQDFPEKAAEFVLLASKYNDTHRDKAGSVKMVNGTAMEFRPFAKHT